MVPVFLAFIAQLCSGSGATKLTTGRFATHLTFTLSLLARQAQAGWRAFQVECENGVSQSLTAPHRIFGER